MAVGSLEDQGIAWIKGMKVLSGNGDGENPGTDGGVQLDDALPSKQLATKHGTWLSARKLF